MVMYGHAFAIAPQTGKFDFIATWVGHGYSGSLAVVIFFFLSGLVVTNSLLEKKSVVDFIISRSFRIFPALIFVVVVSAFVMGTLVTRFSFKEYFSDGMLYQYIYHNISLNTTYFLPGVFVENKYPLVVNGSLWTLPYEVAAYVGLLAIFMLGIFRSKILSVLIFAVFFADPFFGNQLIFTWRSQNSEIDFLIPSFALGVLVAIFKDQLEIDGRFLVGMLLIYFLLSKSQFGFVLFHLNVFAWILWLSAQNWLVKLKPRADLSYGVYLWGFPVQQVVAHYMPDSGVVSNQIISMTIVLGCAWISWHVVERQSIALGKGWVKKLQSSRLV